MRRRTKRTCFNCGTDTRTSITTREQKRTTYICAEAKCWNAYYKSLPPLEPKKGRGRRK